jgi:hypothetical protein
VPLQQLRMSQAISYCDNIPSQSQHCRYMPPSGITKSVLM